MHKDLHLAENPLVHGAVLDARRYVTCEVREVIVALGKRDIPHAAGLIVLELDLRPGVGRGDDGEAFVLLDTTAVLRGLVANEVRQRTDERGSERILDCQSWLEHHLADVVSVELVDRVLRELYVLRTLRIISKCCRDVQNGLLPCALSCCNLRFAVVAGSAALGIQAMPSKMLRLSIPAFSTPAW